MQRNHMKQQFQFGNNAGALRRGNRVIPPVLAKQTFLLAVVVTFGLFGVPCAKSAQTVIAWGNKQPGQMTVPALSRSQSSEPIPAAKLGAIAGAQYRGDGLSVVPEPDGARLHCVFQKLEGQVSSEGLWLTSTVQSQSSGKFRVAARAVGREGALIVLPRKGAVTVADKMARYVRQGLTEEYSVSVDGVRQDFVVMQRPAGNGPLRVELDVTGAKAEALPNGARLVLASSGRKVDYRRLHVKDAQGVELMARVEVACAEQLTIIVQDTGAVYPVLIDPTFSDANWVSMGTSSGLDGSVQSAVVDASGNLYIGGSFTVSHDVVLNGVAKWDGSAWSALGSGMGGAYGATVYALVASGSELYAGGSFTTAGGVNARNVAKWDGNEWSALGSGVDALVYALAVWGTNLYAGGGFELAGGVSAHKIAKWDGSAWSALGSGMEQAGYVRALVVSGSDLYAGGHFTTAGGTNAAHIAKWNGSTWSPLADGVDHFVYALAASGNDLYAGGFFTTAGGISVNRIARWDGQAWWPLGSGMDAPVNALAVVGTELYAGGIFNNAGGTSALKMAKWDGNAWSPHTLGGAAYPAVYALAPSGGGVYVGGTFGSARAGGLFDSGNWVDAANIAKWDGSAWSSLGQQPASGLNGGVYAVAISGNNLYVGGGFTMVGEVTANKIAKWDGSAWSALDSGMNAGGAVYVLEVSGTDLYAGGNFTAAGATNVAKWNGSGWSALGQGISDPRDPWGGFVFALAVSGTNLYAGGRFNTGWPNYLNCIARWDGNNWSAVGAGMAAHVTIQSAPSVSALAVLGSDLYAGGSFTTAGGIAVYNIAKWNGSVWSTLGGMSGGYDAFQGAVQALVVSGSDLYAGGLFTKAGAVNANHIAKWSGSSWSALGSGIDGSVKALVASGSDLYAGGDFYTAGRVSASKIAKWDGSAWSALGSGTGGALGSGLGGANPSVMAMGVAGTNLFVGGEFFTAGGRVSVFMARAILPGEPRITSQPINQTIPVGGTSRFSVNAEGLEPLFYQWLHYGTNLTDGGRLSGVSTTNLTISNVQSADAGSYTVLVTNLYGSVTSQAAVLTVGTGEPLRLVDYYPVPLNAQWIYEGFDWDGNPAKSIRWVVATNTSLTLYTGRSPVTSYSTNVVSEYDAYVNPSTMIPYDEWITYLAAGSRFGYFGDSGAGDIRADGGVILPEYMTAGSSVTNQADVYVGGTFAGGMTLIVELMERTSVIVPAGSFPDVLRIRIATGAPGDVSVHDEWWAKWVGSVKKAGVSGSGVLQRWELIQYSVAQALGRFVLANPPISNGTLRMWLDGSPGATAVVDTSVDLKTWTPWQTNTLSAGGLNLAVPMGGNQQFFRARIQKQ